MVEIMKLIKSIQPNKPLLTWTTIFDYRGKGYGYSMRSEPCKLRRSATTWEEWIEGQKQHAVYS